jgi:ABC-type sulfate/molybdate transport systems ATPase subunit
MSAQERVSVSAGASASPSNSSGCWALGNGSQAQKAVVFVRPHDLEIAAAPNGHPSFPATVRRINSAGASVRLELTANSGEKLSAEVSHDRYRELDIEAGSTVYDSPRAIRIFGDGQSLSEQIAMDCAI